jgi:hypothetical protein
VFDQKSFIAKYIYDNVHFKKRFRYASCYLAKLENNRRLNERILNDFALREQEDRLREASYIYLSCELRLCSHAAVGEVCPIIGPYATCMKQSASVSDNESLVVSDNVNLVSNKKVSNEKVCFSSDVKKMEEALCLDANIRLGKEWGLGEDFEYAEFSPLLQEEIAKNFFISKDDYPRKDKVFLYCASDYCFMKVKGNADLCGLNVGKYLYTKLKEGSKYFLHFKEYEFYINIKKYSEKEKSLLWHVCACEFSKKNDFNEFNLIIKHLSNKEFVLKREGKITLNEDTKERILNTFNNVFKVEAGPSGALSFSKNILRN